MVRQHVHGGARPRLGRRRAAARGGGGAGGGVESELLLRSTRVRLNGALLETDASGALPRLRSVRTRGPLIVARPLSVAFHVFPEAGVVACMTEKQEQKEKKERRFSKMKRSGRGKRKKAAEAKAGHNKSVSAGAAGAADCTGDPEWCRNQKPSTVHVAR